jgi:hypothetical protein
MITFDYIKDLIEKRTGVDVRVISEKHKVMYPKKMFIMLANEFAPQIGSEQVIGEYINRHSNNVVVTIRNRGQVIHQKSFDYVIYKELRNSLMAKAKADSLAKKEILDFIIDLDELETLKAFEVMRNLQKSA